MLDEPVGNFDGHLHENRVAGRAGKCHIDRGIPGLEKRETLRQAQGRLWGTPGFPLSTVKGNSRYARAGHVGQPRLALWSRRRRWPRARYHRHAWGPGVREWGV